MIAIDNVWCLSRLCGTSLHFLKCTGPTDNLCKHGLPVCYKYHGNHVHTSELGEKPSLTIIAQYLLWVVFL